MRRSDTPIDMDVTLSTTTAKYNSTVESFSNNLKKKNLNFLVQEFKFLL